MVTPAKPSLQNSNWRKERILSLGHKWFISAKRGMIEKKNLNDSLTILFLSLIWYVFLFAFVSNCGSFVISFKFYFLLNSFQLSYGQPKLSPALHSKWLGWCCSSVRRYDSKLCLLSHCYFMWILLSCNTMARCILIFLCSVLFIYFCLCSQSLSSLSSGLKSPTHRESRRSHFWQRSSVLL